MLSRLFFGLSILLALSVAAIVFFVASFDANHYKTEISQLVKKNTGRDLRLNGNISLSVYPNIALNLGSASLSNAVGFGTNAFATVKSAKVGVQLMPLLKKTLVIEKIHLDGLQLDLHKKSDGSTNWAIFTGNSQNSNNKQPLLEDLLKNLSIAGVELKNATIHWRDDTKKQDIQISSLNLDTGIFRVGKPLNINLQGTLTQKNPALSVSGSLSSIVTLSQNNTHFNFKNTKVKATASGLPISQLELSGTINGTAKVIDIAGLKLHLVANKGLLEKGSLQANLTGKSRINIAQQQLQISAMNLQTQFAGLPNAKATIRANITGNTSLNLKNKQLHIANMQLTANSKHIIADNSYATTKISGDTQLNLDKQLLMIKAMQLNNSAANILDGAGTANTQLNGNLQANLKSSLINISAMNLVGHAKDLPQIGNINAQVRGNLRSNFKDLLVNISELDVIAEAEKLDKIGYIKTKLTGNLSAKIKQQQFMLNQAKTYTILKGEALSGGNLVAQLNSANISANIKNQHFKLTKMNLNTNINGGIVPGGKLHHSSRGNVDINLLSKKGNAQLANILLEMAGAKLTGSARLTQLSPQPSITGMFKTNQFNLRQVLTLLGVKLPVTSKKDVFGQTQASFKLIATPDSANIKNLNMTMDQSTISGNLTIQNFSQPIITSKLKINQLVADNYLAPVNPQQAKKSNPNDKLLPVAMLKKLNLNGSLDIGKLHFEQLKLTQVHANISAKNGLISAKPLRFNAFKGKYNGSLNLNVAGQTPFIKMSHQIQRVRSENLLMQFFQDRYVSGGIFLNTNLTSRGNTIATLKQNLNGTADLEFREGTIRDSRLAQKISLAVNAFEKRKTTKDGKQVVTFTKLGGNWKANRGIFTTNNMQLVAPHFLINGKGNINIVKNQLDLRLRLGSKRKDSKIFAPLHIHGAFDKLKYDFELDVLLKSLLKEDLYKKKAALKQHLLDEKAKALSRLEERKQAELEKLQAKKEQAQQRLKAEQEKIKQRLQAQQQKIHQQLQDQIKQEQEKLRNQLNDKLKNTMGEKAKEITEDVTEDIKKNLEEDLKDKLKDSLRGLF
jgi:uncharacterized protein involved in outer membrane biogenesis